jgi:[ribosomal protein S18]-alanine N-acetyltransferase
MVELERETPNVAHWTPEQYQARIAGSESRSAGSFSLVAQEQLQAAARVIGFLVAHQVDKEWELENLVVAENARRRGVGFRLATKLVDRVREANGTAIFLEVRESNRAARGLYRKLGFEESGRRKGYYPNPPEDAILCRIKL